MRSLIFEFLTIQQEFRDDVLPPTAKLFQLCGLSFRAGCDASCNQEVSFPDQPRRLNYRCSQPRKMDHLAGVYSETQELPR